MFEAQVLLDRAGFGPGVIDGRHGRFFVAALTAFQQASGLNPSGTLDKPTLAGLRRDGAPIVIRMLLKDDVLDASFLAASSFFSIERGTVQVGLGTKR
ncbi:peptidoglycan-binding domain-containing protein [Sphingobium sp.]|uniref:peptidoglycan-binding domain-containing protein n=1 Tax=Sphingobium sp. TaxID=1912891 RepID=UPI002D13B317|nr:peptidoglycan-binding domain-containing protein [Sphingobium sp.]HUD91684.1 peptidoglycan-binding domain-containing protein [Sphingobium sp.]